MLLYLPEAKEPYVATVEAPYDVHALSAGKVRFDDEYISSQDLLSISTVYLQVEVVYIVAGGKTNS